MVAGSLPGVSGGDGMVSTVNFTPAGDCTSEALHAKWLPNNEERLSRCSMMFGFGMPVVRLSASGEPAPFFWFFRVSRG